jgi:hypothetical protein
LFNLAAAACKKMLDAIRCRPHQQFYADNVFSAATSILVLLLLLMVLLLSNCSVMVLLLLLLAPAAAAAAPWTLSLLHHCSTISIVCSQSHSALLPSWRCHIVVTKSCIYDDGDS